MITAMKKNLEFIKKVRKMVSGLPGIRVERKKIQDFIQMIKKMVNGELGIIMGKDIINGIIKKA